MELDAREDRTRVRSHIDEHVGSKTIDGLTYLELILLNVQRQVGDDNLSLTTGRASGGGGSSGLGRLGLPGGLLDTADGGIGGVTTDTRTAAASATPRGRAGGLEDVVKGRVEFIGSGHVDGRVYL